SGDGTKCDETKWSFLYFSFHRTIRLSVLQFCKSTASFETSSRCSRQQHLPSRRRLHPTSLFKFHGPTIRRNESVGSLFTAYLIILSHIRFFHLNNYYSLDTFNYNIF